MISNENIKNIIADLQNRDIEVRVRDIAYVSLKHLFNDINVSYKAIFGNAEDYEVSDYDGSTVIEELTKYMEDNFFNVADSDISFEENKAYMLKLKSEVERSIKENKIPKKDGYKMLTDISIKLNDKFNVSEDVRDSVVIVNNKYNDICPRCHTEISRRPMTKKEAMETYNLIENK